MAPRIDPRALDGAVDWYVRLSSGVASEADRAAWHAWRASDPEHERAWLRTEAVTQRFDGLPAGALPVLGRARRRAVSKLLLLACAGAAGAGGVYAWREDRWRGWSAQLRVPAGERREMALEDHSRLVLNGNTALDVQFSAQQRLLALYAGEILVEAAADPRPFIVRTLAGSVTALSSRFLVRHEGSESEVQVLDGAVRVEPAGGANAVLVSQGMRLRFVAARAGELLALQGDPSAWTRGMLQVDGMPLAQFLRELQRYRSGWVDCAPEVADMPISGAFPLGDTDRILEAVADSLGLQLRYRTRYWVSLLGRQRSA